MVNVSYTCRVRPSHAASRFPVPRSNPQFRSRNRKAPAMRLYNAAFALLCISCGLLQAADEKPPAAKPVRPGVKTPGVQTPITELKPEAVFEVPGTPDWQVIGDGVVYVSNKPKNSI